MRCCLVLSWEIPPPMVGYIQLKGPQSVGVIYFVTSSLKAVSHSFALSGGDRVLKACFKVVGETQCFPDHSPSVSGVSGTLF